MNKSGYTLLEVTLFMAISGLLALVAFIGLGPRLRNVRFTDSIRSIESSVQRNLAESTLGGRQVSGGILCTDAPGGSGLVISRPSSGGVSPGSTEHCVLNGRVAILSSDNITYRYIVSRRQPRSSCREPDVFSAVAQCYNGTILSDDQQPSSTHTYSHGVKDISSLSPDSILGYGYIVHPEDSRRVIFNYSKPGSTSHGPLSDISAADIKTAASQSVSACYQLSSRRAQITFTNQTLTPVVNFEGC